MHYEDLTITGIYASETCWYATLDSKRGGKFSFPIADLDVSEEELSQNGIVTGKTFLGVIENDRVVALDGFSFIEAKSKPKNR